MQKLIAIHFFYTGQSATDNEKGWDPNQKQKDVDKIKEEGEELHERLAAAPGQTFPNLLSTKPEPCHAWPHGLHGNQWTWRHGLHGTADAASPSPGYGWRLRRWLPSQPQSPQPRRRWL